jgi:hypothetical protein
MYSIIVSVQHVTRIRMDGCDTSRRVLATPRPQAGSLFWGIDSQSMTIASCGPHTSNVLYAGVGSLANHSVHSICFSTSNEKKKDIAIQ